MQASEQGRLVVSVDPEGRESRQHEGVDAEVQSEDKGYDLDDRTPDEKPKGPFEISR